MKYSSLIMLLAFTFLLTACASTQRPVLYPNAKFESVGKDVAQAQIDKCLQMAKDAGIKESKSKKTAKSTAKGAAKGGIIGGAMGLVTGDTRRGGAIGAVGGAAAGLTNEVFKDKPDPMTRRFVGQCLAERGYKIIGWQ